MPLIAIGRRLAPELVQMNREGALNGHIPVTAVNSAILLCASILYGFRYIVFSNERSADEATLVTLKAWRSTTSTARAWTLKALFAGLLRSR